MKVRGVHPSYFNIQPTAGKFDVFSFSFESLKTWILKWVYFAKTVLITLLLDLFGLLQHSLIFFQWNYQSFHQTLCFMLIEKSIKKEKETKLGTVTPVFHWNCAVPDNVSPSTEIITFLVNGFAWQPFCNIHQGSAHTPQIFYTRLNPWRPLGSWYSWYES